MDLPAWAATGKRPIMFPVSAARAACQADGFGRCDRCHRPRLAQKLVFWTRTGNEEPPIMDGAYPVEQLREMGRCFPCVPPTSIPSLCLPRV
jgi:hypothetical protein